MLGTKIKVKDSQNGKSWGVEGTNQSVLGMDIFWNHTFKKAPIVK